MTSVKNITSLARKWQKIASIGRRTNLLPRNDKESDVDGSDNSPVAQKGHFVVYSNDQRRFELPLTYLNSNIFQELLKLSEDEFGLSSDGPITLPCDAVLMDYIISLMRHGGDKGLEKEFLTCITTSSCTFSDTFSFRSTQQQSVVYGY